MSQFPAHGNAIETTMARFLHLAKARCLDIAARLVLHLWPRPFGRRKLVAAVDFLTARY